MSVWLLYQVPRRPRRGLAYTSPIALVSVSMLSIALVPCEYNDTAPRGRAAYPLMSALNSILQNRKQRLNVSSVAPRSTEVRCGNMNDCASGTRMMLLICPYAVGLLGSPGCPEVVGRSSL